MLTTDVGYQRFMPRCYVTNERPWYWAQIELYRPTEKKAFESNRY